MINAQAFAVLDPIADSVDPLLGLIALLNPFLPPRWPRVQSRLRYYSAALLSVGGVYALKYLGILFHLWSSLGLDYSTHAAFAVATGFSIAVPRPRWRKAVSGVVGAYLLLMAIIGYHTVAGLIASALATGIIAASTLFVHRPGATSRTTDH